MEDYTFLRQLADSWGLLALFLFFVGMVIWVFRPGASQAYQDSAKIPFRHANSPSPVPAAETPAEDKEARI